MTRDRRPKPVDTARHALRDDIAAVRARLDGLAGGDQGTPPPFDATAETLLSVRSAFALSPFEANLLLLAAAVELDADVASLCGGLHQQNGGSGASFALASRVFEGAHWSALLAVGAAPLLAAGRSRFAPRRLAVACAPPRRRAHAASPAGARLPGRLASRPPQRGPRRRRSLAGAPRRCGAHLEAALLGCRQRIRRDWRRCPVAAQRRDARLRGSRSAGVRAARRRCAGRRDGARPPGAHLDAGSAVVAGGPARRWRRLAAGRRARRSNRHGAGHQYRRQHRGFQPVVRPPAPERADIQRTQGLVACGARRTCRGAEWQSSMRCPRSSS